MALTDLKELKIFRLNRIKYQELWDDAVAYIRLTYNTVGQQFNTASPFALLLLVILHMGRMIFYYIEDSITGLNIRTSYRPDQIKGLALLAGHDAARPISARGAIKIAYYDNGNMQYNGAVCYIPNKILLGSKVTGLKYTVFFGAESAKITLQGGNYLEANIIQGEIKLQAATGTGEPLLSFNFAERNYAEIDLYYVNVYVNNEPWDIVPSLLDLGFNQKGCIVRTGLSGGIDVFFGNESMGMIPAAGSTILVEYIISDGLVANIPKETANINIDMWEIYGNGTLDNGDIIPLNENFKITCITDIIFGTLSENTALTLLIAPHTSRSFVLANETNYYYFFKRMNMFSDIEIIQGTSAENNISILLLAYDLATYNYNNYLNAYNNTVSVYGEESEEASTAYDTMMYALKTQKYAKERLYNNTYIDNTIFIYLVPDITKRISSALNYFSCDESLFFLSDDEQNNIINLINASGLRLITVENRIIQPKIVRFAVNVLAKIWDGYNERDVYAAGLDALSNYFLSFRRIDIIPVSDIVSIFENNVKGIDSVKVLFDADVNNAAIYNDGDFYGLDEYGDIVLTRKYIDNNLLQKTVRDILPLIRGGFTSPSGIEYSNQLSFEENSAYNLIITGYSVNRRKTLENYTPMT